MKILIVSHYLPPHQGGVEYIVENQARELRKLGHQVRLISSNIGQNQDVTKSNQVLIPALNPTEAFGIPYPFFSPIKLYQILYREIIKSDIVHIHGAIYMFSVVTAYICAKLNKPLIMTEHVGIVPYNNFIFTAIESIIFMTFGKYTASKCRFITVENPAVQTYMQSVSACPVEIVANGIDDQLFHPVSSAEKLKIKRILDLPSCPCILFAGRLVSKKGANIISRYISKDYLFILAGNGNLTRDLFYHPDILHLGPISQNKLSLYYQACDWLFYPQFVGEGIPLVISEAIMSGLPVITFNPNLKKITQYQSILCIDANAADFGQIIRNKNIFHEFQTLTKNDRKKIFKWIYQARRLNQIYQNAINLSS